MNYAEYIKLSKTEKNDLIKEYRDKHFWEIPESVIAIIMINNKKIVSEINTFSLRDEHPNEFIKASEAFKEWKKEKMKYTAHLKTLKKEKAYKKEKEAKERKRKAKAEYDSIHPKKMTNEEKVLLREALSNKNIFFGNKLNTINTIIAQNKKNIIVDTYDEALDAIIRTDIRALIGLNVKLKENFACGIIYGNTASIDADANGIYRYFSWNPEHSKGYVLSYIDIVEIISNINYAKALNLIIDKLKINVKEGGWAKMQERKYVNNIKTIENFDKELSKRYPLLYRYIKRNMIVLEKLNCIGLASVNIEENSYNKESIFFASMQHISSSISIDDIKVDKTRVNRAINVFAVLGLIVKVPRAWIPSKFKQHKKINREDNDITFFTIKEMDLGVLAEAEERAERLKEVGLSATHITIEKVREALGDIIAEEVYGNTAIKTAVIIKKKTDNKTDNKAKKKNKAKKVS